MHLDQFGLPAQANGDANDQLQRVGMILVGRELSPSGIITDDQSRLYDKCVFALNSVLYLQPVKGWYVRYTRGNTNNVSADQLISALCAHIASRNFSAVKDMFKAMCKRLGFAQNYKDGLNGDLGKKKLPDFMALRALSLFARTSRWLYPLACVADVLLVLLALTAVGPVFRDGSIVPRKRGPDDVDDNNTILTLAVCSDRMPTPFSYLARKIYGKLRPWNYGCADENRGKISQSFKGEYPPINTIIGTNNKYHPVYGALRWYHRAEAGGNPEIAEMWAPICKRYFE